MEGFNYDSLTTTVDGVSEASVALSRRAFMIQDVDKSKGIEVSNIGRFTIKTDKSGMMDISSKPVSTPASSTITPTSSSANATEKSPGISGKKSGRIFTILDVPSAPMVGNANVNNNPPSTTVLIPLINGAHHSHTPIPTSSIIERPSTFTPTETKKVGRFEISDNVVAVNISANHTTTSISTPLVNSTVISTSEKISVTSTSHPFERARAFNSSSDGNSKIKAHQLLHQQNLIMQQLALLVETNLFDGIDQDFEIGSASNCSDNVNNSIDSMIDQAALSNLSSLKCHISVITHDRDTLKKIVNDLRLENFELKVKMNQLQMALSSYESLGNVRNITEDMTTSDMKNPGAEKVAIYLLDIS